MRWLMLGLCVVASGCATPPGAKVDDGAPAARGFVDFGQAYQSAQQNQYLSTLTDVPLPVLLEVEGACAISGARADGVTFEARARRGRGGRLERLEVESPTEGSSLLTYGYDTSGRLSSVSSLESGSGETQATLTYADDGTSATLESIQRIGEGQRLEWFIVTRFPADGSRESTTETRFTYVDDPAGDAKVTNATQKVRWLPGWVWFEADMSSMNTSTAVFDELDNTYTVYGVSGIAQTRTVYRRDKSGRVEQIIDEQSSDGVWAQTRARSLRYALDHPARLVEIAQDGRPLVTFEYECDG